MNLQATVSTDHTDGIAVEFVLENTGDEPVAMTFPTGEWVRIAIYDADSGEKRWESNKGRAFTQAIVERNLEAGETISHNETWPDPDPGTYEIKATLLSDRSIVATTSISVT